MFAVLRKTLFSKTITAPAVSKWGKLVPALDSLVFRYALHGLWPAAFMRLNLDTETAVENGDVEGQLMAELMFNAVTGARYAKACGFLADAATRTRVTTLGLILEPTSALSAWLQRRARDTEDTPCKRPALDIMNPEYSIVTAVL
eukprot:2119823-Pyramimonas_sp.AAC.1